MLGFKMIVMIQVINEDDDIVAICWYRLQLRE